MTELVENDWKIVLSSGPHERGYIRQDASDDELTNAMDLVYLMLGRAISDWGEVEKALANVFANCFPIMSSAPAGHAFFEPRSFQTQLRMTSRAVLIACQKSNDSEALSERWWEIFKQTEKLSYDRNKLAHGSVVCDGPAGCEDFFVRFEAFASAGTYNKSAERHLTKKDAKHWDTTPKTFTALELHNLAADFYKASDILGTFSRDLRAIHK